MTDEKERNYATEQLEVLHKSVIQITDLAKVLQREMQKFLQNYHGSADSGRFSTALSQIEILSKNSLAHLDLMLEKLQRNPNSSLKVSGEVNFYKLLQVDSTAETTIIRYAYRYLAARYHPGNSDTGSPEDLSQANGCMENSVG